MQAELPEINSRLKLFVGTFADGNVAGFVRKCGLKSHQVFSRVLKIDARSGKYPKPSQEMLAIILGALPTVSPEWLYLGIGQMLKDESPCFEGEGGDMKTLKGNIVPFYTASPAANTGNNDVSSSLKPSEMLEIGGILFDSECALCVYGDSMAPDYQNGSVIGLREVTESFIRPGEVYVVETANGLYFKRLYINDNNTAYRCVSDNTTVYESGALQGELRYQVFEIPMTEVRRLFRVIGVIKRNDI